MILTPYTRVKLFWKTSIIDSIIKTYLIRLQRIIKRRDDNSSTSSSSRTMNSEIDVDANKLGDDDTPGQSFEEKLPLLGRQSHVHIFLV